MENFLEEYVMAQSKSIQKDRQEDARNSQAFMAVEELVALKKVQINLSLMSSVIALLIYWISAYFNYEAMDYQSDD